MVQMNPSLLAKPDKEHVLLLMPFFAEASSRLGHSAASPSLLTNTGSGGSAHRLFHRHSNITTSRGHNSEPTPQLALWLSRCCTSQRSNCIIKSGSSCYSNCTSVLLYHWRIVAIHKITISTNTKLTTHKFSQRLKIYIIFLFLSYYSENPLSIMNNIYLYCISCTLPSLMAYSHFPSDFINALN